MKALRYWGILLIILFFLISSVVGCGQEPVPPPIPESASLAGLEQIYITNEDPGFEAFRSLVETNLFPGETTEDMAAALYALASKRAELREQKQVEVEDVKVAAFVICLPVPGKPGRPPSESAIWERTRPEIISGASTNPSVYWELPARVSTELLWRPFEETKRIVSEEPVYSYWDLRVY